MEGSVYRHRFILWGCLSEELMSFGLSVQELRLCYLIRARLDNKTIALLFNIVPRSVLKAKQRIKINWLYQLRIVWICIYNNADCQ